MNNKNIYLRIIIFVFALFIGMLNINCQTFNFLKKYYTITNDYYTHNGIGYGFRMTVSSINDPMVSMSPDNSSTYTFDFNNDIHQIYLDVDYSPNGSSVCGRDCSYGGGNYSFKNFDRTVVSDTNLIFHEDSYKTKNACAGCDSFVIFIRPVFGRYKNKLNISDLSTAYPFDATIKFDNPISNMDIGYLHEFIRLKFFDNTNNQIGEDYDIPEKTFEFNLIDALPDNYRDLLGKTITMTAQYYSNKAEYVFSESYKFSLLFADIVNLNNSSITPLSPNCYNGSDGGFKISSVQLQSGKVAPDGTEFRAVLKKQLEDKSWRSVTKSGTVGTDPKNSDTTTYTFHVGETIRNYQPGTYQLWAYAHNIAAGMIPITIPNATQITYTSTIPSQIYCINKKGSINILAQGGNNSKYDIKLTNSTTQIEILQTNKSLFSNLDPGDYSVNIKDGNSCEVNSTSNITLNTGTKPEITRNGDSINPACYFNSNGIIPISVTNSGNSAISDNLFFYKIRLSSKSYTTLKLTEVTPDFEYTGLSLGNYTIYVSDKQGCHSDSLFINLTTYANPINITSIKSIPIIGTPYNLHCKGDQDGQLSVIANPVTGTTSTISKYNIVNNVSKTSTDGNFATLGAGWYKVQVTDSKGCTAISDSVQIIEPQNALTLSPKLETYVNGFNNSCFGTSDVQITASTPRGGIPDYKFNIDKNIVFQTDSVFTGLNTNSHTVYVIDALGCIKSYDQPVTFPAKEYTININKLDHNGKDISCFDQSDSKVTITSVAGGAVAPFKYKFNDLTGDTYDDSNSISGLKAGTNYSIKVQDALGCITKSTFDIIQPQKLTVSPRILTYNGSHVSCNGEIDGRIHVKIGGGTPNYNVYLYKEGDAMVSPYVNAIDKKINVTDTICDFIQVKLDKTKAYVVFAVDVNGCISETALIQLNNEPAPVNISSFISPTKISSPYNLSCNGYSDGQINVKITGGTKSYSVSIKNLTTGSINSKVINSINDSTFFDFQNILIAGSYLVKVIDSNNCAYPKDGSFSSDTLKLTQPAPIKVSIYAPTRNGYEIPCHDTLISVKAHATGGNKLSYAWSDPNNQTDSIARNLGPGFVSVKITDDKNCPSAIDTLTLKQPAQLYFTKPIIDIPHCAYTSDGAITINATGGIQPFTFTNLYNNIVSTTIPAIFNSLPDGNYHISVSDKNGCPHDSIIRIIDNPKLTVMVAQSSIPHCFGGDDAWLKIKGLNGNKLNGNEYKFDLFDKKTNSRLQSSITDTALFAGLPANQYMVTVTDGFGCTDTISPKIEDANQIKIDTSFTRNICFNDSSAALIIHASGAYKPYSFSYHYANDSMPFTVINDSTLFLSKLNWNKYNQNTAEQYAIHIYDSHYVASQPKCVINKNYTLLPVNRISVSIDSSLITCLGTNNGKLRVNQVTGSHGACTYSWSGPQPGINLITSDSITNLGPGTYTVTLQDKNKCQISASRTLMAPNPLTITLKQSFAETASGAYDGKAIFNVTGTNNNISYWINNGSKHNAVLNNSTLTIDNLSAATYTIVIANQSNPACTASNGFVINHVAPVLSIVPNGILDATTGKTDGEINVTSTGYALPYTYYWVNAEGDTSFLSGQNHAATIKGLPKGIYSLLVRDNDHLFSDAVSATIKESDALTLIRINSKTPSCSNSPDGSVEVLAHKGSGHYNYWWTDSHGTVISNSAIASSLLPGNYVANAKDIDFPNNIKSIPVNVEPNDTLRNIITETSSPLCYHENSGKIEIKNIIGGSGNYNYLWSNGTTSKTLTDVGLGNYAVTIYDNASNGVCSITKNFVLDNEPARLSLKIDSMIIPSCYGRNNGKIYASAHGGTNPHSITWEGSGVTGNYLFNVKPGAQILSVIDDNYCKAVDTVTLQNAPKLFIDAVINQPLCNGSDKGNIAIKMLNGRADYSAKWTPDLHMNDLTVNVSVGNYGVKITDANGCTIDTSFKVIEPEVLKIDSFAYVLPSCSYNADGQLKAFVSGGTQSYYYKWSNFQYGQRISGLASNPYSVTVTDSHECQTSLSTTLHNPDTLKIVSVDIVEPSCSGYGNGSLSINASGGTLPYTYVINNSSTDRILDNLHANQYSILVKDAHQCIVRKTQILDQPSALIASVLINNIVKCAGECSGSATITPSGSFAPYQVLWSDNITELIRYDLCAQSYKVNISDDHNCHTTKNVLMTSPEVLNVDKFFTTSPACFGSCNGKLEIHYTGGTQPYSISVDNKVALPIEGVSFIKPDLCAGDYVINIADQNNCNLSQTFTIAETPKVFIRNVPDNFDLCVGQLNLIDPGVWQTYSWNFNGDKISDSTAFNANKPGNYKLNVVSDLGCTDSIAFTVKVSKDLLKADFLIPNDAIAGDTVEIVDISWPKPDSISWQFTDESIKVLSKNADRQKLVFNENGEYTINLIVKKAQCVSENSQSITIYNNVNEKTDGKQPVPSPGEIQELYIYPNPSSGTFTVKIKLSEIGAIHLQIAGLANNNIIAEKDGESSDLYDIPFDLPGLISGAYILTVKTENHLKTVKFVILK